MNKNLNIDDIQKFTKYYTKLNTLTGGGSTKEKKAVYEDKLGEYTQKLNRSGVNISELKAIIQSGGDPIKKLNALKQQIEEEMMNLNRTIIVPGDTTELNKALTAAQTAHTKTKDNYKGVVSEYSKYAYESKKAFDDLITVAKAKVPISQTAFTQEQINSTIETIQENFPAPPETQNILVELQQEKIRQMAEKEGFTNDELIAEKKIIESTQENFYGDDASDTFVNAVKGGLQKPNEIKLVDDIMAAV